tara:strand:- start:168 stop:782 length:615 start_codon:yes stop_codon:yes gene_type:complete
VIAYCSATGTLSTIAALKKAGWRMLVVATGHDKNSGLPYAIDNGAWSAFNQGKPFDTAKFRKILKWSATQDIAPDWVVLPDIVAGGLDSLEFSMSWHDEVRPYSDTLLLAIQDGMEPKHIEPIMKPGMGIFLGGSTEWKLRVMPEWGEFCKNKYYYHIARVNTVRRILYASSCGADSFDGTSVCQFPVNLKKLNKARNQMALPF